MMGDIVINSYKEQIKETTFKARAIEVAGFNIIVETLKKRGINTGKSEDFFQKIKSCITKEDLDKLTIGELNEITIDINNQVTRELIAPIDISDSLIRESRLIAQKMSINGKVTDDDKFVKVGSNLASEVNKHGISYGLNIAIRNYCLQKMYLILYNSKVIEREKELGIINTKKEKVKTTTSNTVKNISKKEMFLSNIIKNSNINSEISFLDAKKNYSSSLINIINNLNSYK